MIFEVSRVCVGSRERAQLRHLKLNVIRLLESGHPHAMQSLLRTRNEIRLEIGLREHAHPRCVPSQYPSVI